jgi:hypothetical protein
LEAGGIILKGFYAGEYRYFNDLSKVGESRTSKGRASFAHDFLG